MKKITKIFALLLVVMSVLMIVPTDNISAKTQTEKSSLNYTYKELDTVNATKFKLKVDVKGFKASKATFKSSNKKVAKVSKKGVVTAKKEGTAIITVKYGGYTYQCGVVVFDGKGALYDLRKDAKCVRDNCSLIALNFREFVNGAGYFDNEGEEDYTFMNTEFTHLYKCYEVRENTKPAYADCSWVMATHAFIDFEQTKKNLLATGLFEEDSKLNKYNSLTGVKPIKPFTYKGTTYEYIAEYSKNGKTYYISSYTGMIYDTFSSDNLGSNYYPCYFRITKGYIFGAKDNGDITYAFYPTTNTINGEKEYMEETGFSHKNENFSLFWKTINLQSWYENSKRSNFSADAPEDVK